jgi:hypothetical protein
VTKAGLRPAGGRGSISRPGPESLQLKSQARACFWTCAPYQHQHFCYHRRISICHANFRRPHGHGGDERQLVLFFNSLPLNGRAGYHASPAPSVAAKRIGKKALPRSVRRPLKVAILLLLLQSSGRVHVRVKCRDRAASAAGLRGRMCGGVIARRK